MPNLVHKSQAIWGSPNAIFNGQVLPSVFGAWGINVASSVSGDFGIIWGKTIDTTTLDSNYGIINGFMVKVFDEDGNHIHTLNPNPNCGIKEIKFSLTENGCGDFEITSTFMQVIDPTNPASKKLLWDKGYRIEIYLYYTNECWYSGYVIETPNVNSEEGLITITGSGFFKRLGKYYIDNNFYNMTSVEIVDHVAKRFISQDLPIKYSGNQIIESSAPFQMSEFKINRVKADEVISQLSKISGDYVYGVDANRKIFFRERNMDVVLHVWVGLHSTKIDYKSSVENMINRLYVKCGKLDNGGSNNNFAGVVEDITSQELYGLFEDEQSAPSFMDYEDSMEWGQYIVDQYKDPVNIVSINDLFNIDLTHPIKADGKIRVVFLDGTEVEFYIKKVDYVLSESGIVQCSIEAGDLAYTLDNDPMRAYRLKLARNEQLNSLNMLQV